MQSRRQFVAARRRRGRRRDPRARRRSGRPGARAARPRAGRFAEGVVSGDPDAARDHAVARVCRRRAAAAASGSRSRATRRFRHVVAREHDHDGAASAATRQGARHRAQGRTSSTTTASRPRRPTAPVGRFRTALPADSRQPVRFAFFSCQDYTHGFYNAHDVLAREDLDFVVCLGDYIYAETYHAQRAATGGARRPHRQHRAPGDVTRRRSRSTTTAPSTALYRSDPALRRSTPGSR